MSAAHPFNVSFDPDDPQAPELLRALADILGRRGGASTKAAPSPVEPKQKTRGPVEVKPPDAPVSDLATEKARRALNRQGFKVE